MNRQRLTTDVVIFGGGIAGLWLHRRLNDMGYHALLLENGRLGQGQTLSSQGIIHGGSKYALNGILSKASQVISLMPARWKACLDGEGEINLHQVNKLADHQLLWSKDKLSSKLVSFFASKALRSRMQPLKSGARPALFEDPAFKGTLYQLDEPVLDVPSLLQNLVAPWHSRMLHISAQAPLEWLKQDNQTRAVFIGKDYEIQAQHFVLAAGEGNEALLDSLGLTQPEMQRRPLQMVLCKSRQADKPLPMIYAHSLGSGAKPIATLSSHQDKTGNIVWYIGGNIAEEGVGKAKQTLINEAKQLLQTILPWFELPDLEWATHSVNRAEPKQSSLTRPDSAFVDTQSNLHICWPTKLALAPDLADQVITALQAGHLTTGEHHNPPFEQPKMAEPLWDRAFL
ncbi:FAD-dependent oxidoreductase [Methylophaga sp. OBS4]|uniref:FAD-dependent oxidoreductase n=1 Tax=Methylophaga sp. OBS4 TaxID=2991935 RepID=UPI002251D036|nr:FAD-dependent oxidoreductase [Methylophaga sp. OBS4]MCX4187618.1 FAD-dependent oxidoreductase [Methylophaga sp. OBS4]